MDLRYAKTYDKPNQQLTVPQHFYRPPNSRNWYVRLVPPRHIKQLTGEREFHQSTGQSDLKRARPIRSSLITDKLREWDSLARSLGADSPAPGTRPGTRRRSVCPSLVLVLNGSNGGLNEPRAALYASHGFAALALAYFNTPGSSCEASRGCFLTLHS